MQLLDTFLASWCLQFLCVAAFSMQFVNLRLVTLSLAVAFPCGALAASYTASSGSGLVQIVAGILAGILAASLAGTFDLWCMGRNAAFTLLASLGVLKVLQAVLTLCGFGGIQSMPFMGDLGAGTPFGRPVWLPYALVVTLAIVAFSAYLRRSRSFFLSTIAVGDSKTLSSLYGISPTAVFFKVQVLGGAIAGATGVFLAADNGVRPDLGTMMALKAFAILSLSRSSLTMQLVLTALLVITEYAAAYYLGGHAREALGLVLLCVIMLIEGKIRGQEAVQ